MKKDILDAREEAKRAKEAAERARCIGIILNFSFGVCFLASD
jgi:hypothetical protein